MPENRAFVFQEAEVWVKPAGLNSQSIGFASEYSLDRNPVLLEDGSAAFYRDRLTIESPWVDADVTTLFYAKGPFDSAFVRWKNEDDGRLESVSVTKAVLRSTSKRPAGNGLETFQFVFEAGSTE